MQTLHELGLKVGDRVIYTSYYGAQTTYTISKIDNDGVAYVKNEFGYFKFKKPDLKRFMKHIERRTLYDLDVDVGDVVGFRYGTATTIHKRTITRIEGEAIYALDEDGTFQESEVNGWLPFWWIIERKEDSLRSLEELNPKVGEAVFFHKDNGRKDYYVITSISREPNIVFFGKKGPLGNTTSKRWSLAPSEYGEPKIAKRKEDIPENAKYEEAMGAFVYREFVGSYVVDRKETWYNDILTIDDVDAVYEGGELVKLHWERK